jgi:hypothetical protein
MRSFKKARDRLDEARRSALEERRVIAAREYHPFLVSRAQADEQLSLRPRLLRVEWIKLSDHQQSWRFDALRIESIELIEISPVDQNRI